MSGALDTRAPEAAAPDLVAALGAEIDAALRALVPVDRPVALLDFPVYSNVGDSAIWLGATRSLKRRGVRSLAYVCSFKTWSRRSLARAIGDGTILLSGGGNFGDRYAPHQRLREEVIAAFPSHRILQLPQSIWFQSADGLERARRVLGSHQSLTLLVRDRASLEIARREFRGTPSLLCPDMAFGLGSLAETRPPSDRVVWLSRTDTESVSRGPVETPAGFERVDWVGAPATFTGRWLHRAHRRLRGNAAAMRWLYGPVARARLRRGVAILSGARSVVSDRLHGHILCLLLGIPHVVLPNSNGKVRAFFDTWTHGSPLAHWCDGEAEALRVAQTLRRG